MKRLVVAGVALTAVVTVILWWVWGDAALIAAITFGLLATAIQLCAVAVLKPAVSQSFAKLMARWGIGMGLRMLGIVLFVVAVLVDRELFPPLPAAFGYLGVLIPLLFTEMRFLK